MDWFTALALGFGLEARRQKKEQQKQAETILNRPLSSRQVKKEKLRHEGLVPVSKGSQAL